jgi:hypothetical protein
MFGTVFHFSSLGDLNWQKSDKVIMTECIHAPRIYHLLHTFLMSMELKEKIGLNSLKVIIESC